MIVSFTPNPAVDRTWELGEITLGDSIRIDRGWTRAGGKGVNVARVLTAQGRDVRLVLPLGGDTGAHLRADLEVSGIDFLATNVTAETRTSMAFYEAAVDRTTIFNERGTALSAAEWDRLFDDVDSALAGARAIVLSGSMPPGDSSAVVGRTVAMAQRNGAASLVDTSGSALRGAAQAGATLLLPNLAEIREGTGCGDPITGARMLCDAGAGAVLVTLGPEGMLLVSSGRVGLPKGLTAARVLRARLGIPPLTGNPTGAGDAGAAAVASAVDEDVDVDALLTRAVAWSAAAVLMPLAGEISPRHEEMVASVVIEELPD